MYTIAVFKDLDMRLTSNSAISGLMTGQEVIKKNPAAERGANVVGCNWVLKIVNGKILLFFPCQEIGI